VGSQGRPSLPCQIGTGLDIIWQNLAVMIFILALSRVRAFVSQEVG
jgi:hypothetical protein